MNIVLKIIAVLVAVGLVVGGVVLLLPILTGDQNAEPEQGTWIVGEKREDYSQAQTPTATPTLDDDIPEYLTFSGTDGYVVSSSQKDIELKNPEENRANFVFSVIDAKTNEVIAKTGKVAPGQYAYVNVYDYYSQPGTYDIRVYTEAFSFKGVQLNSGNLKAIVVVL